MKNLSLLLYFIIISFSGTGQSLSGIWTGVLSNDSLTIRKDQSFEIALTEYRGKVYGYAYSTFIVNDTLYYILKRVKGNINGDICEVEDDEVITHNFQRKPEKGVSVIYTFRRNITDSVWKLDGEWKTTATKKYYSISGGVNAKQEKDLTKSKLYDHLGDLNLQNTLVFEKQETKKPEKKTSVVKKPEEEIVKTKPAPDVKMVSKPEPEPVITAAVQKPDEKKPIAKAEFKPVENKPEEKIVAKAKPEPAEKKTEPVITAVVQKPEEKKPLVNAEPKQVEKKPEEETVVKAKSEPVITATVQKPEEKSAVVLTDKKTTDKNPEPEFVFSEIKRTGRKLKAASALVDSRVSVPSETIFFRSDSLQISLYDNGEVDGDTVSVIINDEMFIEKQGLKSAAFRKTFYVPLEESDSLLVVLYADNLGKYPPNTGLLQIKDGQEIYYVRFKADLDRNAAIMLRRKYK